MSTNPHYAVEILEKLCNFDFIEHCLIIEIDDGKYNKRPKLLKLHEFDHAFRYNFKNLLEM